MDHTSPVGCASVAMLSSSSVDSPVGVLDTGSGQKKNTAFHANAFDKNALSNLRKIESHLQCVEVEKCSKNEKCSSEALPDSEIFQLQSDSPAIASSFVLPVPHFFRGSSSDFSCCESFLERNRQDKRSFSHPVFKSLLNSWNNGSSTVQLKSSKTCKFGESCSFDDGKLCDSMCWNPENTSDKQERFASKDFSEETLDYFSETEKQQELSLVLSTTRMTLGKSLPSRKPKENGLSSPTRIFKNFSVCKERKEQKIHSEARCSSSSSLPWNFNYTLSKNEGFQNGFDGNFCFKNKLTDCTSPLLEIEDRYSHIFVSNCDVRDEKKGDSPSEDDITLPCVRSKENGSAEEATTNCFTGLKNDANSPSDMTSFCRSASFNLPSPTRQSSVTKCVSRVYSRFKSDPLIPQLKLCGDIENFEASVPSDTSDVGSSLDIGDVAVEWRFDDENIEVDSVKSQPFFENEKLGRIFAACPQCEHMNFSRRKKEKQLGTNSEIFRCQNTSLCDPSNELGALKRRENEGTHLIDNLNSAYLRTSIIEFVSKKEGSIAKYYTMKSIVEFGKFSQVYRCSENNTGKEMAAKVIPKEIMKILHPDVHRMRVLFQFLLAHSHPNLVRIHRFFEDEFCYYIIMDMCEGPTAFQHFMEYLPGTMEENEIRDIMLQILLALDVFHSHDMIHGDVKFENLMFKKKNPVISHKEMHRSLKSGFDFSPFSESIDSQSEERASLCLVDLDTAKVVRWIVKDSESRCQPGDFDNSCVNNLSPTVHWDSTVMGTAAYMSPEAHDGLLYSASDMWSCGILLYALVDGNFPFDLSETASTQQRKRIVLYQRPFFNPIIWSRYKAAADLCLRLLEPNPMYRIQSAKEALIHHWFSS
ncbi:putative serine/threonine protein kinase STK2 [Cardiosporidium cionae]|uniref:Serine/threonine protein kinase STK2 n=1 Tax=Cardiosporidium cionae TaxID=476202 RepID=A0ABQ7J7Q1_9APIC|nr:putative serine/threonine protein kinase STK2 [Cardiosporidium cionae]|eukprot:KAF8820018.1 putative serine/threonine protein kinase STK2 [Cardiosporidium cionae]